MMGRGAMSTPRIGTSAMPPAVDAKLSVHHLAVVVEDLGRAEAFYAGVLGLAVIRRWEDDRGSPRSVWLALGGGAFLAVERAGEGAPASSDPPHLPIARRRRSDVVGRRAWPVKQLDSSF